MNPEPKPASSRPDPCSCLLNTAGILTVRRSLLTLVLVGRKQPMFQNQYFPQKHKDLRIKFPRIISTVRHSPDSTTTIELHPALAKSSAYAPDTACHGILAQTPPHYEPFRETDICPSRATSSRRAQYWSSKEPHRVGTLSATAAVKLCHHYIMVFRKNKNRTECGNYRCISLAAHAGKILLMKIIARYLSATASQSGSCRKNTVIFDRTVFCH